MAERKEVFLSFAHADLATVRRIAASMARLDLPTWEPSASLPAGADWVQEIEAAIEAHDRFVFFVSPSYMASARGNYELGYAMSRQRAQGGDVVIVVLGVDQGFAPSRYLERFNVIDGRDKSPEQIAHAIARAFEGTARAAPAIALPS